MQAFKSYDEAGVPRRIHCLKYLVLASMLMGSQVTPHSLKRERSELWSSLLWQLMLASMLMGSQVPVIPLLTSWDRAAMSEQKDCLSWQLLPASMLTALPVLSLGRSERFMGGLQASI